MKKFSKMICIMKVNIATVIDQTFLGSLLQLLEDRLESIQANCIRPLEDQYSRLSQAA